MKTRFNLLPWREKKRAEQQQRFVGITVFVGLICAAIWGYNYFLEKKYIEQQNDTIAMLTSDIQGFERAKKEVEEIKSLVGDINKQITTISALSVKREVVVDTLAFIANNTPEEIFLNSISFNGQILTIDGVAKNDAEIANFMRKMKGLEFFTEPRLRGINAAKSSSRYTVPEESEIKTFTIVIYLA
ncbi:PilN domain-containing protein [Suttonella sp. R2A3]|uniref:PilN domain-containing protein n=1 Tax=Suttonella sp. R2A3 TaxID=2908648 RepID=UPI001F452E28|nr:PilN domain-containing protein [Suttonella sp. R2A3]UJF25108.1 PilN domain-containing protein [Suttonella sp. R2A3]